MAEAKTYGARDLEADFVEALEKAASKNSPNLSLNGGTLFVEIPLDVTDFVELCTHLNSRITQRGFFVSMGALTAAATAATVELYQTVADATATFRSSLLSEIKQVGGGDMFQHMT